MRDQKIHVLVADNHPIMRKGLALVINNQNDMEVVGEASNGQQAIELTRSLQPNILITEINLPRISGLEVAKIIAADFPETLVIGLSIYSETEMGGTMRQAGAIDYVSKSEPTEGLLAAIRNAVALK